jgi:hypothetical protein
MPYPYAADREERMKYFLAPCTTRDFAAWAVAASVSTLVACGGGDFRANIGGNIAGLANGQVVILQNNGNDDTLIVSQNGKFLFSRQLELDDSYNVTVRTQPTTQICEVIGGKGNVNYRADDVSSMSVICR